MAARRSAIMSSAREVLGEKNVADISLRELSDRVGLAKSNVAFALLHRDGESRKYGLELLRQIRDIAMRQRYSRTAIPMIDVFVAQDRALRGDLDGAIELSRAVVKEEIDEGGVIFVPIATNALVEALLKRGTDGDIQEAQSAVDRLRTVEIEPGIVLYDIWTLKLRTLIAQAKGDDATYRQLRDRYRKMAGDLGFEGHMAWAEAMD